MIIIKILLCIIILILVPMCVGLLVTLLLPGYERSIGLLLPVGYLTELVLFELVTLPVLLTTTYGNFQYVVWIYTPLLALLSLAGVYAFYRNYLKGSSWNNALRSFLSIYRKEDPDKKYRIDSYIVWGISAAVMIFILIMALTNVIFDGDDAYYVVQSLITQQKESMYVIQPYTGGASPIDMRHAMAVFTMWITYVGTVTGLHTTIVCHTVLPLVLIPLSVVTYSEVGIRLLKKKEDMLPYFVLFTELLILFGRVSEYTAETFLISRTWQGKSMAANLLLPMAVLTLLLVLRNKDKGSLLLLAIADAAAGVFSSLSVMIISILIAVYGIWYWVYTKKFTSLIKIWLCCLPGALYMILYLYFTYFAWTS